MRNSLHPDAGKITLTGKLLLFGRAIQLAGEAKARGERRRVRSDWMAVERERGISVSSTTMSFMHAGLAFNLLDTPGHQDFRADTYRTLTALDSAVLDAVLFSFAFLAFLRDNITQSRTSADQVRCLERSETGNRTQDHSGARRKNLVGVFPPLPLAYLKCGSVS
jgi:hypothetical protein